MNQRPAPMPEPQKPIAFQDYKHPWSIRKTCFVLAGIFAIVGAPMVAASTGAIVLGYVFAGIALILFAIGLVVPSEKRKLTAVPQTESGSVAPQPRTAKDNLPDRLRDVA